MRLATLWHDVFAFTTPVAAVQSEAVVRPWLEQIGTPPPLRPGESRRYVLRAVEPYATGVTVVVTGRADGGVDYRVIQ